MSTESVYLFNMYVATPTYHDYGESRAGADVTVCGLVIYDGRSHATHIRRDHADSFARACRRCFPASAGSTERKAG